MTNSTETTVVNETNKLLNALFDSTAVDQVRNRLDTFVAAYNYPKNNIKTTDDFNNEISRIVQNIYQGAIFPPQKLSPKEALTEAIHLLEQCQALGDYESALVEPLTETGAGIVFILQCIAQTITDRETRRTANLQYSSTIDPTDWKLHHKITETLLNTHTDIFSPEVTASSPAQFARHYRELIESVKNSYDIIRQITTSPNLASTK